MPRSLYIPLSICICVCLFAGCAKTDALDGDIVTAEKDIFTDADIQEQTVYDGQGLTIKAVSLDMNAPDGPTLMLSGENRTGAARVVTIRNCSVNNIMAAPVFEMKIGPNGDASSGAVFSGDLLEVAGIRTFTGISFVLRIAGASEAEGYFDTDQFNMFTSMSGKYTQKYDFPGAVIADADGVIIKIGRVADDKAVLGKQIYIYIDNSTSTDITVESTDTRVNGIPIDPMFFAAVGAGKKCWAPLVFQDSDIVKNSVESIDDLVISLRAVSIYGTIADTGACQVTFSRPDTI